jgi:hypothetical protein
MVSVFVNGMGQCLIGVLLETKKRDSHYFAQSMSDPLAELYFSDDRPRDQRTLTFHFDHSLMHGTCVS